MHELSYTPVKVKPPITVQEVRKLKRINQILMALFIPVVLFDLWERRLAPDGNLTAIVFDLFLLVVAAAFFTAMLALWLSRLAKYSERVRPRFVSALWPFSMFTLAFVVITLNIYEIPFHAAFAWSKPALERAVLEVQADPTKENLKRYVGVFPVDSIGTRDGISFVHIEGGDGIDYSHDLVWTPGPSPSRFMRLRALGGNWYWVMF